MSLLAFAQHFIADLRQHWPLYAAIPVVAALIGYVSKVLAVQMMFKPMHFVGCPPYLGWQGVVPRHAHRMAETIYGTLTHRLLSPADLVARLDPWLVAYEMEQPLRAAAEDITREVAAQSYPGLWESLPTGIRSLLVQRVQADIPACVEAMLNEIAADVDEVFDARQMLIEHLTRDKELLNRIFETAGEKEFQFIRRSGIYFGFGLGCIQVLLWALTHSLWVMPVFGAFIGWFSDWLALKMVFRPREPTRYLGLFAWQGLFLKRRHEVATAYGEMIAAEVITARNIFESALTGRMSDRLMNLVGRHVQNLIEQQAGVAQPLLVLAVGGRRLQQIKAAMSARLIARLPGLLRHAEDYVDSAMDVRGVLVQRMQSLSTLEFERVLRPVFEQDEWKLIAVGALLGFLIGELQVIVMLHV